MPSDPSSSSGTPKERTLRTARSSSTPWTHSGTVGGFCIVSSDTDCTRLATRIREQGLFVIGVGRAHTPEAFVKACEVFVYTQNLAPAAERTGPAPELSYPDWTLLARRAVEMTSQDVGRAFLGAVGNALRQLDATFDVRSYGQEQLPSLIRLHHAPFVVLMCATGLRRNGPITGHEGSTLRSETVLHSGCIGGLCTMTSLPESSSSSIGEGPRSAGFPHCPAVEVALSKGSRRRGRR